MRNQFLLLAAAAALAGSTVAFAQTEQDHAAHHPASAASASKAVKPAKPTKPKAPVAASAPTPAQVDAQMQAMRDMHDKMMAAKTPEERQALMADHMKAMQDGMAMMDRMQSGGGSEGGMPMHHEGMAKRMDMMQMMMQMMMDRDAAAAPMAR